MSLVLRNVTSRLTVHGSSAALLVAAALAAGLAPRLAAASCAAPVNAIEAENCLPGSPQSEWAVAGAGSSTIQGFTTDISVNRGTTVQFKVESSAAYRLDVYRMGYYGGAGARLVTRIDNLPAINQPNCLTPADGTGLIDCGNWSVTASWPVPATAVSGIYFARATRLDGGGASHVFFVVRDDASTSDILFQTADTTWQAYNEYGGASLYFYNGGYARGAYKVSYNRPFTTNAVSQGEDFVWNGEYPMVRWLEANAYDVTYHTGVDAHRAGALIRNHRIWMSNGHDEYWSGQQRANVEAARDAGVHLMFLSGNKIFWKTRMEPSVDGSATANRTIVCYKETKANAKIDPSPEWTGTWRDPRFSPPSDGGRPENELGGTIFMINGMYVDAVTVTAADGLMRFWRNTDLASLPPGTTATLAPGTLGAEVDVDLDNGFRPPGLFGVSTNVINTSSLYLLDYGSTYGAGSATHRTTLYRHPSGALVFGTGSYSWSWGLDANHERTDYGATTDARMQQATVNLLADMGTQPGSLQPGLLPATPSTDATAPVSVVTSPLPGATIPVGTATITGTAADTGGVVGGVEVSIDNGTTWHPASGRESWSYTFTATAGAATIRTRAVDDSGNLEVPSAGTPIVIGGVSTCTECSLWSTATVPGAADTGPDSAVELGVRFRAEIDGYVKAIRFYKGIGNTGTHVVNLWTTAGALLSSAIASGETATGWQEVALPAPVRITANTLYVASYHAPLGHYAGDVNYFTGRSVDSPPLHAPADAAGAPNGVYRYGGSSAFPNQTWNASNYWVDVVFTAIPPASLQSIAVAPANPSIPAGGTQAFTATGTYSDGSTRTVTTEASWSSSSTTVATVSTGGVATAGSPGTTTISASIGAVSGSSLLTVSPAPLVITTASLPAGTVGVSYLATLAATGGTTPYGWSIVGTLPPGLVLAPATGAISGTPTAAGTASFTAQVSDVLGQTATRALSIDIAPPPADLQSIAVTPANPAIAVGATQAFTATGTYSDGSTAVVTTSATWSSSATAVATVSTGGVATAGSPGTTTISASIGAVSGSTLLTVSPAPLVITTASLPAGTVGVSYLATLAATGGTTPYGWSIVGTLPPGLVLAPATGAISGTPTAAGTASFTVQATDALGQTAARALSIAVAAPPSAVSIWSAATVPGLIDGGADSPVELGVRFRSDVSGYVSGIRFYKAAANTGTHVGSLWSASGQRLANATFVGETASGWQQVTFAAPVAIQANTYYVASYHATAGHYSADLDFFATQSVDSAPLHAPADGVAGGNGVYAYGAAGSFPNQVYRSTNYWVDVLFSAAPPPALQSISVTPATATVAAGATQQFTATATYSDGSTANLGSQATWTSSSAAVATVSATGLATGVAAGAATVTAAVGAVSGSAALTVEVAPLAITTTAFPDGVVGQSYSVTLAASGGVAPRTWAIAAGLPPGLALAPATGVISGTPTAQGAYSFTVQVTDALGTVATRTLSITTVAATYATSIWSAAAAPIVADAGPDAALTVGVKFRSDVAGFVTGIRFYKSARNTGTHVGALYRTTGTRLASATFASETASGWQTVRFSSPIAIAANTVYVAAYHTTVGYYAADVGYFLGKGEDNPPLHALANGVSGSNGVYRYGSSIAYPNRATTGAVNYWVDVTFTTSSVPATLQSIAILPANPTVTVGGTVQLAARGTYSDGSTANVPATWTSSAPAVAAVGASTGLVTAFNAGSATLTATSGGFTATTTVTVQAGTPPPDEGPGGPILVVTHGANPFTRYLGEILKAEGLNAYRAVDVAKVTPALLAGYDVAILGEFPLTSAHVTLFSDWVNAGGNLVAMRPDKQLAGLLGLTDAGTTLADAYLRVATGASPGAGIVGESIQFHGTADRYALAGATAVATLWSSATTATTAPAVTLRAAGLGRAAAFTYDLARSVVYTRQGNPAWSGMERDGQVPVRSDDLFFGASSADYVDLGRVAIPQADEQQRLLVNLVGHMNATKKPLPRFWYFPSGHKAVVVMTGDDHANGATIPRFAEYAATSAPGCSVDDWECIRASSYVYPYTPMTDAEVATYQALGFEIGVHVSTGCANWTSQADLDGYYASDLAGFQQSFPSAAASTTHRTHCIVWSDYDTQPKVELSHGIRLDTNYYYWPGSWVNDRPGFMTGSGIPMRFASRTGELIDVFQAATQMTDESEQSFPFTIDSLLDNALGPLGYYGAFTANMHTDFESHPGSDAIVASALARGVPIVSANQLLTWLDGRDGSYFGPMTWSGDVLTFDVFAAAGARNLRAMVPASAGGVALTGVTRNGVAVPHTIQPVKGVSYAFFPATTGTYQATYR